MLLLAKTVIGKPQSISQQRWEVCEAARQGSHPDGHCSKKVARPLVGEDAHETAILFPLFLLLEDVLSKIELRAHGDPDAVATAIQ